MFSGRSAALAAAWLMLGAPPLRGQTGDVPNDSLAMPALSDTTGPLIPDYALPPVTVTAVRLELASILAPTLVELDRWATSDEAAWRSSHLPGTFLKSYGGPGALRSLSVGGGSAAHTAVLLEGIPLNSPQFGGVDLTTIPLQRMGRIAFLPHGGTAIGSSTALSGAINLVPRAITTGALLALGSYGLSRFSAEIASPGGRAGVALGQTLYRGGHGYNYRDQIRQRENNAYQQRHFQGRAEAPAGEFRLTGRAWLAQTVRGVPGPISSPSPDATQEDDWSLVALSADLPGNRSHHRWQLYGQTQGFIYRDPASAIDARHDVTISGAQYLYHRWWPAGMTTLSRLEIRRETLESTAAGSHRRWPWSLGQQVQATYRDDLQLLAALRIAGHGSGRPWTSGDVALRWQPTGVRLIEELALMAARNLRQPTFNDLYWVPGGNPHLTYEQSATAGVRSRWRLGPRMALRLDAYHTAYTDLIEWAPGVGGISHAGNISAAQVTYAPLTLDGSFSGGGTFEVGLNLMLSENQGSSANRGKPLRYNPPFAGHVRFTADGPLGTALVLQGAGSASYVTNYNYPEDKTQPGHWRWDIYLRRHLFVGKLAHVGTLGISNLADADISTVLGYPEPGRTLTLTWQMERR